MGRRENNKEKREKRQKKANCLLPQSAITFVGQICPTKNFHQPVFTYNLFCLFKTVKCPYCGSSNLIWDNKSGDIICAVCGSVIDKIYCESADIEEEIVIASSEVFKKHREQLKKIKETREKKMVIYNGSLIKESSLNAMKLIENNEKLLIIYDIIDNSTLKTRNIKYKLAIGLYLYDRNEFEKVEKSLGISEKYMKKILLRLKAKEKIRLKNMIRERLSLSSQRLPSLS